MNHGTIAGHLGVDPEERFTSSGQKVITLRVAARARKGGKDETIWWQVSLWGDSFDKLLPYFKKGSSIVVFGEINKPEIFTDREGKPQVSMSMTGHHIAFSPFGKSDSSKQESSSSFEKPGQSMSMASSGSSFGEAKGDLSFSDDEVPF